MMQSLTDKEITLIQERVKHNLQAFHEGTRTLEFAFESAAKHMPVYLKIVKGHIEQLAKVLRLESHNQTNLDNIKLAEPVIQLIKLFREMKEADIELLETLAYESRHWAHHHRTDPSLRENTALTTEA